MRYLWITIIEVLCSYKCPILDCLFHGVFSLFKFKIHLLCTVLYTVKVWRMGPWTLRTRAALVGRHTRQQSSSLMARRLSCTSGTPRAKADFVQLSGRLYWCFPIFSLATTKPSHPLIFLWMKIKVFFISNPCLDTNTVDFYPNPFQVFLTLQGSSNLCLT